MCVYMCVCVRARAPAYTYVCVCVYIYIYIFFFNELHASACSKAIIRLYMRIKNMKFTTVIVFKLRLLTAYVS